jgi:predicted amidohydrolase YtcJ
MILDNALVLTMDATLARASALAIAGGKVLGGVDSREDAIASHAHERIDLQGATVVPGFVDSHTHFRSWALAQHRLNVSDASTRDELVAAVETHELGADSWLLGGGWADELAPTSAAQRDEMLGDARDRPVALQSRDGHALIVTDATLESVGVSLEEIASIDGGVVELGDDGTFTGVLREQAAWHVRALTPTDDLDMRTMASAMRLAARRGVTSIDDMDGAPALRMWRTLELERGLSLRVRVHMLEADLSHISALGVGSGFGSDRLEIGGLKLFADGTLGSGTALLHHPELNASALRRPVEIRTRTRMQQLAIEAAQAGLPLLIHAIGDAAVTNAVDALEATIDHWSVLDLRPRIEHAQLIRPEDATRCAQLGIALSVQPSMLLSDQVLLARHWGDRRDRAFAFRTMLDAGCGLLFGSDAPVEDLDPLAAIRAAVERPGDACADQVIDVETALLATTAWPADAAGLGDVRGRLTPGRQADLAVLSGNPLTDPLESIEVVATMVGGRWTFGAANLGLR